MGASVQLDTYPSLKVVFPENTIQFIPIMRLHLPKRLLAAVIAAGLVGAVSAAGTSQIGADSNVIRLDNFSQSSLNTLGQSWTLSTNLRVSEGATTFTSGSPAATITEKEDGKEITTLDVQGSTNRYIYSTVVTIDAASISKSTPVLSGQFGLSVADGLIKASYQGSTWNDSANTGIQVLTSDANADGTLTIGMSFRGGNSGTTIYVGGRSVTMSGLRNSTDTKALTLAGVEGVTYSNLYVFNTSLSDENMKATMDAAGGGTQSNLGTLTWAGTETGNTWNLATDNTNWSKDGQAVAFSWGKYTTVFDDTAASKNVSVDSSYWIGTVIQVEDNYTFNIGSGSNLTALSGSSVAAGKKLTIDGTVESFHVEGLTLGEGAVLHISSFNHDSMRNLIAGTSGSGTLEVEVGNSMCELHGASDSSALELNTNVHVIGDGGGITLVGELAEKDKLTISSGKTLTVDGTLWSKRATTVVNGTLDAEKVWIGHEENGPHPGKLQLNDGGSIKTAEISFRNNGGDPKTASTFEMSGGVLEFTQATSSAFLLRSDITPAYSVIISGGTLKAADSSWKIEGISNMSLGGVLFDIGDNKSITFNTEATLTAGMEAKGSGSLHFGADTALTATQDVLAALSGTYSNGNNGYKKAYLVTTQTGQTAQYTADSGGTLTVGTKILDLAADTSGVFVEDNSTYYVNSGEVVYSDTSDCKDATNFTLTGGVLDMQKELVSEGLLYFAGNAEVKLAEEISLNASQVQKVEGVTASLSGSGTLITGQAQSLGGALSLDSDDWTGTVQLSGSGERLSFSVGTLATANSTIELKGVSGWLGIDGTSNAKLLLTDKEDGTYAITVTDGSTVRKHTFSGVIAGSGTWAEVSATDKSYSMVYCFTGDISNWIGQYVGDRADTTANRDMHVSFVDNAGGKIGLSAIKNLNAKALYVGIRNSNSVTMNGNFIKDGTGALNLYVGTAYDKNASNQLTSSTSATAATFGGSSITLTELNISDGSSATFRTTSPDDLSADNTKSSTVSIAKLTGSGNLVLRTAESEHASSSFTVSSMQGYTGSISIEKTENGGAFTGGKAVLSTGRGSDVTIAALNLRGGAGAKITADQNLTIQSLSTGGNNKLDIAIGNAATVTATTGDSTLSLGEVTYSGSANAALSINKDGDAAGAISIDKLEVSGSAADTGLAMKFQNATVSVSEMVLTGGNVGVYSDSGATTEATVSTGNLTVSGSSMLSANLVLKQNASLTLNDALAMGSTLTLNGGITLSGDLLSRHIKGGEEIALFTGVDSLTLGTGMTYTADQLTGGDVMINSEDVFINVKSSDFKLSYGADGIVALVAQRAVPEPTTATLSLLALMGLAARRRRRKA